MTAGRLPWIRSAGPLDEDGAAPVAIPRLDRGIVWSDLVAEMEAEWAARGAEEAPEAGRELGDAA